MRTAIRMAKSAFWLVLGLLLFACGGSDSADSDASQPVVSGETSDPVADEPEPSEEELTVDDLDGDAEELTIEEDDPDGEGDELTIEEFEASEAEGGTDGGDRIEVAEAEEDPVESMLNTVTLFRVCLEDEGFEFIGAPGFGGEQSDFEPDYLAALGSCATETGILDRMTEFGDATASLTPEQIRRNNFGFPTFVECLRRLGWDVDEPAPDENGLLFVDITTGFRPPPGQSLLETSDITECQQEQATYTEENYVESEE